LRPLRRKINRAHNPWCPVSQGVAVADVSAPCAYLKGIEFNLHVPVAPIVSIAYQSHQARLLKQHARSLWEKRSCELFRNLVFVSLVKLVQNK
jgi:hypothetical protein